jgi:hypothetical protein
MTETLSLKANSLILTTDYIFRLFVVNLLEDPVFGTWNYLSFFEGNTTYQLQPYKFFIIFLSLNMMFLD